MLGPQETLNMTDPSAEPPGSYKEQIGLLRNPQGSLRLLGYLSLPIIRQMRSKYNPGELSPGDDLSASNGWEPAVQDCR